MQESISAYLKTEPDSLKDHPPSKFKQNYMLTNQRPVNFKKMTYSTKRITIPNQRDMWKQMFGNFLHDINLKTKKNEISPEAKEHLQDPLVNEVPILIPCTNKQFKLQFYKYLEGDQSIDELMKSINFPNAQSRQIQESRQLQRKMSIVQKIKKFKGTGTTSNRGDKTPQLDINSSTRQLKAQQVRLVDQRRFTEAGKLLEIFKTKIGKKVQVLRDFVQQRIDLRRALNKEQREEEIHNIHFIKTFFDITNDYNQHIQEQQEELQNDASHYKKLVPAQRKLKQCLVTYDNVQPIIKHQEKHFDRFDCPSLGILKNQMNQQSKEYLAELEAQKHIQFKLALNQVRRLLEQQNIKFQSELRKSRIRSKQNSQSSSPLMTQQRDSGRQGDAKDWALDVIVASPKRDKHNYKSISQFRDSIIDPRKRKEYHIAKKPFYLFTKRAEGDKNAKNARGLITNFDVKLYDYIHNRNIYTINKQIKHVSQKFHTMIESEQEQHLNEQLEMQLNQLKNKKLKFRQHASLGSQIRVQTDKGIEEYSDDQSLQSIYEVNLDVLYDQSNQLSKKLREQNDAGFAKRIKQLIKLEQVNTQCLKTNLQKLNKSQNSLKK